MYVANGISNNKVLLKLNLHRYYSYAKIFIDEDLITSGESLQRGGRSGPNQFDDWESGLFQFAVGNGSHVMNFILTDDDGNHNTDVPTIPFYIHNSFACVYLDDSGQLGECDPDVFFGRQTGYKREGEPIDPVSSVPVACTTVPPSTPVVSAPPVQTAAPYSNPVSYAPSGTSALIFGILGLLFSYTILLGFIFSILGLNKAGSYKKETGVLSGSAMVGKVFSVIGLTLSILGLLGGIAVGLLLFYMQQNGITDISQLLTY